MQERQIKERTIIMQAESVRAILEGRKTQTRRVVKPQPHREDNHTPELFCDGRWRFYTGARNVVYHDDEWPSRYGHCGERLWVRESWGIKDCGSQVSLAKEAWPEGWPIDRVFYAADGDVYAGVFAKRSSMFMPRWASRLSLEVVQVRIERVQQISEADALAEGILRHDKGGKERVGKVMFAARPGNHCEWELSAQQAFARAWDVINGKRGFPWESNPWVWVIEFKRLAPAAAAVGE